MAIHKFVTAILNDEEIAVYGDGKQTRDFTYVGDAVEATILAAKSNIMGEVFNVGGGSRISVNELIEQIEIIVKHKAKVKYAEDQKGDVRDTLADTSKAGKLFGWKPMTNIDKGLEKYISTN